MSLLLLHGEDTTASRQHLQRAIADAQDKKLDLKRILAGDLKLADIRDQLGTNSLFATPTLTIIEEASSLGTKLTEVLPLIEATAASGPVIIWEKKALTKKALEAFISLKPSIQEYKPAPAVFTWLDSLTPKNPKPKQLNLLQTALATSDAGLCFAMLQRQVRLLLEVKGGGKPAGPPFVVKKISTQASQFTLEQLLKLHTALVEIDRRQKTSSDYLSLSQELAQIVIRL